MKMSKLALLAAICCGTSASAAQGQQAYSQPAGIGSAIQQVSHCDCGEAVCGCEAVVPQGGCDMGGCDMGGCDGMPACETGCDCGGGCPLGGCLSGDCGLGDPFTLFGTVGNFSIGGWTQIGYHSAALPLFNSRPDEVQLHQQWLYAEKAIDTSNGFDIGGRIDYVYGTDSQDTQAFGIDNDHWDNGWDNGTDYGHAIPQLYVEAGYGDLSVKAGHFYTIIGWEVVTAPDNFFYSHAYTMYNSEPFTHTGALATYNAADDLTLYGGYVLGWDSGFEDNGDAFLGGVSAGVTDSLTVTYATVAGNFAKGGAEKGYMHSIVGDFAVSDNLQYIIQSDLLDSENDAAVSVRETIGVNNYLIYTYSDCLAFGARFEWWNVGAASTGFLGDDADLAVINNLVANGFDLNDESFDVYALTLGVNYKPHANVIVRPEVRWDWIDGNETFLGAADTISLEDGDDDQFTFGIDTIFLF